MYLAALPVIFVLQNVWALKLAGWNPDQVVQDSIPDQHHCVVFLATLYSHSASQPRCINGYWQISS